MTRAPTMALVIALLGMPLSPVAAQEAVEDPLAQRLIELEQSGQGVLLPLGGALDPAVPEEIVEPDLPTPPPETSLATPPPEDPAVIPDGSSQSTATVEEVGTAVVESSAAEVAEQAVAVDAAATSAGADEAPAMEVTEEAGSLPELDAIADIATAELGNPESIGPWRLWLASYRTIREAQAGWQQLAKDNRDLLGDLSPVIVLKELGGEGDTFFRLQAGPLPDSETARTRCDALKERALYCAILGPQDG